MYDTIRQQALDRGNWKGDKNGGLSLQYAEAWKHDGHTLADSKNFLLGSLSSETELQDWLARTATPSKQPSKLLGGIRLLICERNPYPPPEFPLSRKAFERIEGNLCLSALTIPTFESEAGTYSRFLVCDESDQTKLKRVHTILKAPQKREILNWGLSVTHDFETGITSGLLCGTGLGDISSGQSNHPHGHGGHSPLKAFLASVESSIDAWDYPMLLPCLFLSEHLSCINFFCTTGKILTETIDIEHALGVTKVGQSAYLNKLSKQAQPSGNPYRTQHTSGSPHLPTREETEALTVRINTQSTRVVFTARSPEWNLACARFLLDLLAELKPHLNPSQQKAHHDCRQLLEHNITLAEAAASNIAVIKDRMALQLAVLYNFVAQLDNQTSAELAASASRDSTSMKILAFISALFLPGNFVAAMFSMDMFDWSNDNDEGVVEERFWIYWAVAIPLTAVTVAGWALWWYFELGRFRRQIGSIRGKSAAEVTGGKQTS